MKNDTNFKGKTITFYSYKGGVGRSMSLVNIACLMANKQKKVLLIDWDLEAPGLHSFFNVDENEQLGLVDLMTEVISYTQAEENNEEDGYSLFLRENIDNYIKKGVSIEGLKYPLDIMKAGKFDDGYTSKLNAIDWVAFYKQSPAFFRTLAQYLETQYDYILIDSRTGLSDTGGVCTMLMPQILVAVFALNHQNINGVIDVVNQSINYRFNSHDYRNLTVLPLPARIDNQNPVELQKWITRYERQFQDLFKEIYMLDECNLSNYFNTAKIPYEPLYAYGENIPVLTEQENSDNDFFISYHYAQFYKHITDTTPIWEIVSAEQIAKNRTEAIILAETARDDAKAKRYEQAIDGFCRAAELDQQNVGILNDWGNTLLSLAKTKQGEVAEDLYRQAIELYKQAIALKPDYALFFNNYGNALYNLAKIGINEEVDNLCKQAIERYRKAISLMPNNADFFFNLGLTLNYLARTKSGQEAIDLYNQAIEQYSQAVTLRPTFASAFNNYGNVLRDLAKVYKQAIPLKPYYEAPLANCGNSLYEISKINTSNVAEGLYKEAIDRYKQVIALKPDYSLVFSSYALALCELAEISTEKENLYKQAIELYKQAIDLKPDYASALNNYGKALHELAKMSADKEAEDLYKEAIELYKRAIALKPDYPLVLNNYGNTLFKLAEMSKEEKKEEFYKEAIEQYKQLVSLKPDATVLNNCGGVLCYLAKIKENEESINLYLQAIELYKQAIILKPDYVIVFNNHGNALYNLAKMNVGKNAENLYHHAIEQYKQAIALEPNNSPALSNYGNVLCELAKMQKNEDDKIIFLTQALEMYEKAIALGTSPYNLARVYAILGKKQEALQYLDMSLNQKHITVANVNNDSDWEQWRSDKDYLAVLQAYTML